MTTTEQVDRAADQAGILLRRATAADRDALLEMYVTFEPKGASLGLPPLLNVEEWLDWLTPGSNFVVQADQRIVGHGVLCPEGDSAEVAIFVHQGFRGRGLGRLLLRTLVEEAQRMGLRRVWGVTELDNLPMLRLANSLGFVSGDDPGEFYLDLRADARPLPAGDCAA